MATLDEGVANLQRFIAHLVSSTSALENSATFFKDSGGRFSDLADEVGEEGGGLNDELEELGSALESGVHDAEEALTELMQASREGDDAAGEGRQRLDQVAGDVEQETGTTLDGVADANARLASQGFEALGQTLDREQTELEAETRECEQAFGELEAAAGDSETEAQAAWDAAEAELDEATSDLTEAATALEAATDQSAQGFAAAAGEFEQHCTDLASEVDVIYDALDAAVAQEGQEWDQAVRSVVAEALAFVETAGREQVEQPAGLAEDEALGGLQQEYSALGDVLESARQTAEQLDPLTQDLARCQQVVAKVDELLNALAG